MKYLKGTIGFLLCYNGKTEDGLVGYCDSDYAGDLMKGKSTSGYIFMLYGGPIAWSSSLQRVTALSSLEAEYIYQFRKRIKRTPMVAAIIGIPRIETNGEDN